MGASRAPLESQTPQLQAVERGQMSPPPCQPLLCPHEMGANTWQSCESCRHRACHVVWPQEVAPVLGDCPPFVLQPTDTPHIGERGVHRGCCLRELSLRPLVMWDNHLVYLIFALVWNFSLWPEVCCKEDIVSLSPPEGVGVACSSQDPH